MGRHCEKAFSADEAIFLAQTASRKDCFVVPPRNDEFSIEVCQWQRSRDGGALGLKKINV
jgi:hypothetical protein